MKTGIQSRNEAMAQVEANANAHWKVCVDESITMACQRLGFGGRFIADLIWKIMDSEFPGVKTTEHRAMGPAIAKAHRDGRIRATGEYKNSEMEQNHDRPMMIWSVSKTVILP